MNAIRLLPDTVINKIKAGEMIERPANVLKELLENAIDAGATRITVSLQKGGSDEIVVSDNGSGIAADDVPLAIKRHATSKISRPDDLWSLHSLGFRGEALASIAEVSRFTLLSATAEAETGTRLTTDDQQGVGVVSWSCEVGTSTSVRDIFYNVPARRKFLKNAATEYSHCHTCVQALALSHPQIEFILHHNHREQLRAPAIPEASGEEALRQRALALFGEETVAPLLYAEGKDEMAAVKLLFSPPGHDRAHNRHIFTFVNARWVKSTTLKYAILRGYHSHLLKGRYPLVFAYLRVHPSLLDINVHPMKSEVRFQYSKEVQELIALNLRRKLRSPAWSTTPSPLPAASTPAPLSDSARPTPRLLSTSPQEGRIFYPSPRVEEKRMTSQQLASEIPEMQENDKGESSPAAETEFAWDKLTYLGTLARCYLLFEDQQRNLIVVDQHAFHERIIFEQLCAEPHLLTRQQGLTIAETLPLTADQLELVVARQEEFTRLGFALQVVDDKEVLIKGVPSLLQQRNGAEILRELVDLAQRDATLWVGESLVHDVIATLACRAAVKAGDVLDAVRLQQLFSAARGVDFYHNCPHGRRVLRIFTPSQVGGWFDRI